MCNHLFGARVGGPNAILQIGSELAPQIGAPFYFRAMTTLDGLASCNITGYPPGYWIGHDLRSSPHTSLYRYIGPRALSRTMPWYGCYGLIRSMSWKALGNSLIRSIRIPALKCLSRLLK